MQRGICRLWGACIVGSERGGQEREALLKLFDGPFANILVRKESWADRREWRCGEESAGVQIIMKCIHQRKHRNSYEKTAIETREKKRSQGIPGCPLYSPPSQVAHTDIGIQLRSGQKFGKLRSSVSERLFSSATRDAWLGSLRL